ncbi:regulator of G-protein signaling protein-like [Fukomys damarensis]|uniref:regulator of G-protein signaling protein-like n=1 Tax=Fukomys damarensis TaxID=885580 RepID=UPI001454E8B9|nr:regulator of G-protein signaling protein-like [Fukomys damarensis]
MSNAEIIGSTNLIILLENEIFADFFNTFLSLPVFGQTPSYTVENSQWSLWPEIPYHLISKYKGLLTWLEKYRLPFFCKTNLCFHYILCQELISFVRSPEGAKMMRWKKADEWLLEKCIGGVRGMWRFCSYLKGSAGEELVDFWILAEKILSIDEMDLEVRNYYLSLLLMLKATYLQEGSRVVTLCNMNIKSLLNLCSWHPNQSTTRRETLSHMQKVALFKLQSYWLPNFYTHAKMAMASEGACYGLMQEYETRLCSFCYTHMGGLPLNMSIKKSLHFQNKYSSKKAKRKIWQLTDHTSWSLELDLMPDISTSQEASSQEKMVIQMPSLEVPSSKERTISSLEKDSHCVKKSSVKKKYKCHVHMEDLFETKFSTHLRTSTSIIHHPSRIIIKKAINQSFSLVYTHWALCADACAGCPFRDYLKKLNLKVETQLLDLWQDLQHFLRVLMNNKKSGKALFLRLLGDRICELYLNEKIGLRLPLKSQIIQGLKDMLPSGDVNPWIPKAQKEICKMLSPWYDKFLDEEDYWFLIFTTQTRFIKSRWHRKESTDKKDNILLYKRVQESLKLSQALANMEEMESMEWQKIATKDLRQGGSLQVELTSPVFLEDINKMPFEELCYKNPKVAVEKISEDYKIYCEKAPKVDTTVEMIKEQKIIATSNRKISLFKKVGLQKPSVRPRNLAEVLLNTQHLQFFREFLRHRKAENPLLFLIAVQKISMETNEKIYKSTLENIIKTYLHGKHPPEEMLQCNAPIIKKVPHMHHIGATTLLILQSYVMKSLEEKWFKEYQELFPLPPLEVETEVQTSQRKPSKTTVNLQESQKRGWLKMVNFIKSFCSYRRFISNPRKCQEFIEYLHLEMHNKENFSTSPTVSGRLTPLSTNARRTEQEKEEISLVKRRIYGQRIIVINFAVNDLYFLSEMEKFNDLVSSAQMLQSNRAYNENDVVLMQSKINIILRLFLHAEFSPKLRVNITESQKDAILTSIAEGHLDRNMFHGAIMSVFPVIMYFWKRFCAWKATHNYLHYVGKNFKDRKILPKLTNKNPPGSSGDHNILRCTLLRGIEWLRPQQWDLPTSPLPNSSSSNLTQSRLVLSAMQLYPARGQKLPHTKKEKK